MEIGTGRRKTVFLPFPLRELSIMMPGVRPAVLHVSDVDAGQLTNPGPCAGEPLN